MMAPLHGPVPGHLLQFRKRIVRALGIVLMSGAGFSCMSTTALRHEAIALDEYPRDEAALDEYLLARSPRAVETSFKVHLLDGSTVLFPEGAEIGVDRLTGSGERYDIRLSPMGSLSGVARDSVTALESFDVLIDPDRTVKYNLLPGLISIAAVTIAVLSAR
jgi:hypothetical protein